VRQGAGWGLAVVWKWCGEQLVMTYGKRAARSNTEPSVGYPGPHPRANRPIRPVSGAARQLRETMDEPTQKTFSTDELLAKAKEKYHVYHLHVLEGSAGHQSLGYWKELLRENCIEVAHSEDIPGMISDIVTKEGDKILQDLSGKVEAKEEEIIL